jgi:NTE family protein
VSEVKRGLVLGAGGVLGAAWTTGALCAVEEFAGFDVRSCRHLVGTSAGSVLAALLGAGVSADDLRDDQLGVPVRSGPLAGYSWDHDRATGGALPGRPRPRIGSARLAVRAARHPMSITPMAAAAAVLPTGRSSLWSVRHLVDATSAVGQWSAHPGVWVVAMDFDTGRRVAFGRAGAPHAELAQAVQASCSIPAWYAPVVIGGRRYIDGGTCSPTSADLLAGLGLDEVFVLAPMTSFDYDQAPSIAGRLERAFRRSMTRRMMREVARVRAGGTKVRVLSPGRADLEAIGANLMDPSRRHTVLATSLRTSAQTLRLARDDEMCWSG